MNAIVAIPSEAPGGLEANLSAHFGHCDIFTLVRLEDGEIKEVKAVPNPPHQQGGCLAPVNYLAQQGAKVLIAGGMGLRPLIGFNSAGIEVYYHGGAANVGQAVAALVEGELQQFTQNHTCGGSAQGSGPGGCGSHEH